MTIIPEPEWKTLVQTFSLRPGTSILMGTTDSGKSTLARYLIQELLMKNITIALVDTDIGQSSLGVPGTICMKVFRTSSDYHEFFPDMISFIGALNPSEKIPQVIPSAKTMVNAARDLGAASTIVDTTGLVHGPVGRDIKIGKIRALEPEHVIAIQAHDELEHILSCIEGISIYRLAPSRLVKKRSREARIQYRHNKYKEYFKGAGTISRDLKGLSFMYNDKPFDITAKSIQEGSLVGLSHNGETHALGIIEEVQSQSILVTSPLDHLNDINSIIVGDIIV